MGELSATVNAVLMIYANSDGFQGCFGHCLNVYSTGVPTRVIRYKMVWQEEKYKRAARKTEDHDRRETDTRISKLITSK